RRSPTCCSSACGSSSSPPQPHRPAADARRYRRPVADGVEKRSKDELNRELIELLNELRVALPGVQVLFAFLLTVPFANGWTRTTDLQRDLYFVTLLLTALATIFLIAPSAYHRIRFRSHDKLALIVYANRFVVAGLVLLALAMSCAGTLVTD